MRRGWAVAGSHSIGFCELLIDRQQVRLVPSQTLRMFVTCLPGLTPLVGTQLGQAGVRITADGFDGRADLLMVEATADGRNSVLAARSIDDVFVEVGRADRSRGDSPHQIASLLWQPESVQRALSVWAQYRQPLNKGMTFRVITRVLSEKAFRRTDLRQRLTQRIGQDRRRWRTADPAQIEVWACEYRPGSFVAGLRLTDAQVRQHGGRTAERPGALRPAVAAAMVALAGEPSGTLLDPCCGSGTILAEALEAGWSAAGEDIDEEAVRIARLNAPAAMINRGDVRKIALPDASVAACVTNLPFGRQYQVQGQMDEWLGAALEDIGRVVKPGGEVVVLAPDIPRLAVPAAFTSNGKFGITLLGTRTAIHRYRRT
jgi:23S rRNA G2445 N2-methylase RlmL